MSAYEGSAMQERAEQEKKAREERVQAILRENPSLSRADAEEWERTNRPPAPPPPCCACEGLRAEIVRTSSGLGRCVCACHGRPPR